MSEKILMKGNEAMAEGAVQAGCLHFFGYPITPQTEVAAYMARRLPALGGTYLQAESEIAAVNMLLGASAAGVRAMTSSSSPGISLKSEAISYMAGSDLPGVIVNVQRCGPGLGGIQPAQSDYHQATRGLGHGDFHLLVLAPAGVQEMYDLMQDAFDLSDRYRVPALLLADGILGQMMEPVRFREREAAPPEKPWAACGTGGQRARNIITSLHLEPEALESRILTRYARYAEIERSEARCEEYRMEDAEIVLVAYGACARIAKNAVAAAREQGVRAGLLRPVTLWPYPKETLRRAARHARAFVCAELSMGQMIDDVRLSIACSRPVTLAARTGGVIITPEEILAKIMAAHAAL